MRAESFVFLRSLLEAPSPSGYEQPAQQVVREYVAGFADAVSTDVHGNVSAVLGPENRPRVMFAGHCDQIGFMVRHVDENGFISFSGIGGHDVSVLIGQRVTIWASAGPVPGVIARKAIHLLTSDERGKLPEIHDLWIDIGATKREEVERLIRIGDPVTFDLGLKRLRNETVAGVALDDKVGVWVVMEALRLLADEEFDAAVFAVSTVQEEIGLRGARTSAFHIDPQIGVAVDVTHATDTPGMNVKQHGDVKLGKGPVVYRGPNINPHVFERLVQAAERDEIPYQINGAPRGTANDANALQISRGGIATGLISIPNRYMHSTVEMVHLDDLDNCARLLAAFVRSVSKDDDFTP